MASDAIGGDSRDSVYSSQAAGGADSDVFAAAVKALVAPIASLKLTVALFAMSIFLILAGTLAQVEMDMWEVMDQYFRCLIAWIDVQVFFPRSWFPNLPAIEGSFPFPGGATIGTLMAVNLLAAHTLRFKIQSNGARLGAGLGVIALGVGLTWLVIVSGHNKEGLQGEPFFEWSTMWSAIKVALAVLWLASVYGAMRIGPKRNIRFWSVCIWCASFGVFLFWLIYKGDSVALSAPSLRILWQLIQGGLAGVVLLIGCVMVFKKRGGIVLIHAGVGLLMLSELLVSEYAVEERMTIEEGQTVNFARDIRTVELAVVDPSDPEYDDVVVIPKSMLLKEEKISHDDLPFDVEVLDYYKNSDLRRARPDEDNKATAGSGKQFVAVPMRPGSGADTDGKVDVASAYVRLTEKESGDEIGVYLCSQIFSMQDRPEEVIIPANSGSGDQTYELSLRFKRTYKPYSVHLIDARKDDYIGTSEAKSYSSDVRLVDQERDVDREIHIWMNNPLRYAGETFYQSGFDDVSKPGVDITHLQVVTNTGWMIPYVSCMLVGVGLNFHFIITLLRFLRRREQEQLHKTGAIPAELADQPPRGGKPKKSRKPKRSTNPALAPTLPAHGGGTAGVFASIAVVVIFSAWLVGKARPDGPAENGMHLDEFGKLPVVYQGRVKPFDSLARTGLRMISNKQVFKNENDEEQPAILWLLDSITETEAAKKHRVFRIDNPEVLNTLDLPRRKSKLYSVGELLTNIDKFEAQAERARKKDKIDLSVYERKILELDNRIRSYTLLVAAFREFPLPAIPPREELREDREKAMEVAQALSQAMEQHRVLASMQPPLAVPAREEEIEAGTDAWQSYSEAHTSAHVQQGLFHEKANPAALALAQIFDAYRRNDAQDFNVETARYQDLLKENPPERLNIDKTSFEAFYNHLLPFYHSSVLYVFAFILAAVAWLGWHRPLNQASFWLIVLAFALHTFALVGRIYISGRPPVTNLYSSAVFIGWAAVVGGLSLEVLYRLGIGNIIASVAGFATLIIAYHLAVDDTFKVLVAVLDTQFWLATHVVSITLGYTATFVAGLLGIIFVLGGVLSPSLDTDVRRQLVRMIYGTICFAMFFSFVGTVLGGLWADDSWGRFWGWDPKENGALIIVIWNALVLHARWDGMVRDRGMAVLAIGGNIVTSWSWFGVNELGVGLHSYGFTQGVLLTLGIFVISQLALIGIGCLPKSAWRSYQASS